jgi:hypothetical protein
MTKNIPDTGCYNIRYQVPNYNKFIIFQFLVKSPRLKKEFLIILLIFYFLNDFAQDLSNIRTREVVLAVDSIVFDTISIVPGSVFLFDLDHHVIPDSLYSIDYPDPVLRYHSSLAGNKIILSYRTFPVYFSKPYYHKDTALINTYSKRGYDPFRISGSELRSDGYYNYSNINKRGSIARGITFGNSQDMVVNSNLNLQLSGNITDDLRIVAAISDNNIPIQPDGSSQQIHEFDKVYIDIYNDRLSLLTGDFDLRGSPGYFMKFYKKGKGIRFTGNFMLNQKETVSLRTTLSGAISKGKVCRNSFTGTEANQGPYKLRGCDNEQYIILLAGTERVYIDGKLMARGLENDYVIDYNNAEITFTSNQLVTKDKRIIVEFEYSEKNYTRFLLYSSNEFLTRKGNFWINVYSEHDDKNQALQLDLNEDDKKLLAVIGDQLNKAIVQRIDSVGYNHSEVLYKKIDTLISGTLYKDIYIYSTHPDSAVYRLGFSYVGKGNGNYRPALTSANGKVYKWIAPENEIPRGSYQPVVLLVTPKKKQVLSFGGRTSLTNSASSLFEFSLTNNDINTFSDLDRGDNVGFAFKGGIIQDLITRDTSLARIRIAGNYQFTNRYFDPIERFRPVEYERDWNLLQKHSGTNEHLADASIGLFKKNLGQASFKSEFLNRDNLYNGLRNNLQGTLSIKGFTLQLTGSMMNSNDSLFNTNFLRHQILLSKQCRFVVLGVREEAEQNRWRDPESDSLINNSFSYQQYEVFITSHDTARNKLLINYSNRRDWLPANDMLNLATMGHNLSIGLRLDKNPGNRLNVLFTYRSLQVKDTSLTGLQADQSLLGRLEHNLTAFKGILNTSTFYEIGSGLESKKEFTYLEVTPGQGVYSWNDYNENNVKELDEFEIATFQDQARYIRIFTPTDAFINVYTNQFNQSVRFEPARFWRDKTGFRSLLALFSDQFGYRLDRKNTTQNLLSNINPLDMNLSSPGLITISTSIRNYLSFNKTNRKFGIDYIFQKNVSRFLLANGFDTRSLVSNGLRIRLSAGDDFILINQSDAGHKSFKSEFFTLKNFDISFSKSDFSIQYQPGIYFRIITNYIFSDERNGPDGEHATKHDMGIEIRYNILQKGNLTGKFNYINVTYNQDPYTPVAYEMLQGLQPGHNGIWSLLFQRTLSGGVELNIEYSGRVIENQKVVHLGSMQVRWNF